MAQHDALSEALDEAIRNSPGLHPETARIQSVGGGDTHRSFRVVCEGAARFVKIGPLGDRPAFEAESGALRAIAQTGSLRVPQPESTGANHTHAWLVMEHLVLHPTGDAARFGRSLAAMHDHVADAFGWHGDNFLGRSRQANGWLEDWPDFFWRRRLQPQFDAAIASGHTGLRQWATALRARLPSLLGHRPSPALLHGDLWSGNHGYLAGGAPAVFDPAPYYGDRETDLAMMALFGGFHPDVFAAHAEVARLPEGHEERRLVYQLYHLLNHLNLFGPGWLGRVESTARALA